MVKSVSCLPRTGGWWCRSKQSPSRHGCPADASLLPAVSLSGSGEAWSAVAPIVPAYMANGLRRPSSIFGGLAVGGGVLASGVGFTADTGGLASVAGLASPVVGFPSAPTGGLASPVLAAPVSVVVGLAAGAAGRVHMLCLGGIVAGSVKSRSGGYAVLLSRTAGFITGTESGGNDSGFWPTAMDLAKSLVGEVGLVSEGGGSG